MRIAEINDIASVATELARGLRERGHEVDLLQPRLLGGGLPAPVKPIVAPARAFEWARVIRAVRRGRYDIAHIHYAYLGILGVAGRFPYVLHCHGTDVRDPAAYTRPLVRRALRGARRVLVATPDLLDIVHGLRPDATFVPNPIDTETFAPRTPAEDARGVYLCSALSRIKGAPILLDACRRLADLRPDIGVTAIAGGELTPAFAELPNVHLLPRQPREALPALINRHALVLGQMKLGLGMAELEAMACGRPVVMRFDYGDAYDAPPPVVRALDGHDLAHEAIRLHDDKAGRARIGLESRDWVARVHALDRVAGQVERILEEALEDDALDVR
ncbi:MAG: hypothetical protein Kow0010_25260 [Dehalococcoidia bacterium]